MTEEGISPSDTAASAAELDVADRLLDFHRKVRAGESVDPVRFAKTVGLEYGEFLGLIEMEALLADPQPMPHERPLPSPFGEYTLVRELGRGGAGVVYEAVEHGLLRRVALKVMHFGFQSNEHARQRFVREATAAAQLEHPNIVRIYQFGEVEGHPYYAMSRVEGTTLAECIAQGAQGSIAETCARAAELAEAIGLLHAQDIVHRDIKPSNIMVDSSGRWVLADFGLARHRHALPITRTGQAMGTPLYMSPEQVLAERGPLDARTDIYGLGATLHHVLTGRPPFHERELRRLMRAVLSQRPPSLRRDHPEIPAGLDGVVRKCLEKRPADRYRNMSEVADDLNAVATGRGARGRPLHWSRQAWRGVVERPRRSVSFALVFLLAAAGAWLLGPSSGPPARVGPIRTVAGAEMSINDGPFVAVGAPVEVEPGRVRIVIRAAGFRTHLIERDVAFGAQLLEVVPLLPENPDDEVAWRKINVLLFGEQHADRIPRWTTIDGARADEDRTVAIYPRGRVSREDLATYRVDLPLEGGNEFELVWSRDGEEVHRHTVDATGYSIEGEIPPAVRDALVPGDTLRWEVRQGGTLRAEATASFVEDAEVAEALRRLSEDLAAAGLAPSPAVTAALRVRTALAFGRPLLALRTLAGSADLASSDLARLRILVLRALFGGAEEDLRASPTWVEAVRRYLDLQHR